MFLLDSDAVIWHLRKQPDAVELLADLLEEGPLCTSTLTRFEVLRGAYPRERISTLMLLNALETIDVDSQVSDLGSTLWSEYRRRGQTLGAVDCLIAATALVHDLTLVTMNLKDFPMPELKVFGREAD